MKSRPSLLPVAPVLLCASLWFASAMSEAFAAATTVHARTVTAGKPSSPTETNAVADPAGSPLPQSVFNVPATPREGRNPFFPASMEPKPAVKPDDRGWDTSKLTLNGITSPPKPTAMINGRTFEQGESGEVKLRDGSRLLLKCIEIKADSAIIEVRGQRLEVKLRSGI